MMRYESVGGSAGRVESKSSCRLRGRELVRGDFSNLWRVVGYCVGVHIAFALVVARKLDNLDVRAKDRRFE